MALQHKIAGGRVGDWKIRNCKSIGSDENGTGSLRMAGGTAVCCVNARFLKRWFKSRDMNQHLRGGRPCASGDFRRVLRSLAGAPDEVVDPQQQRFEVEGLGQVIVSAPLQPGDAVGEAAVVPLVP
jgi:hypothetical protein